jgi:putative hydrolase of HD superfamily
MQRITNELDFPLIGDELNELWLEYENGDTIEARIAKQLDKFEMIKQADEYEKSSGKVLESFFLSTQDSFEHPEVKMMMIFRSLC